MMSNYHIPVMKQEVIEGLVTNKSGIYIDATFGGGGSGDKIHYCGVLPVNEAFDAKPVELQNAKQVNVWKGKRRRAKWKFPEFAIQIWSQTESMIVVTETVCGLYVLNIL